MLRLCTAKQFLAPPFSALFLDAFQHVGEVSCPAFYGIARILSIGFNGIGAGLSSEGMLQLQ